jgi:hypothetical protein
MESKDNTKELELKYSSFTDDEIKNEYREILAIPNARTNIDALTRMSVLLPIMEKRGMVQPRVNSANNQSESNVKWGGVLLGLALIIGGVLLSMGSGRIFYGAVLVGIGILFKSLI